jgi:23S rRNA pseudouridine2605 synthase
MEERIQKIIAQAGIASRRAAEELIMTGRVTINGQIAQLGQKANPAEAEIRVDGRILPKQDRLYYYIINKPRGVLSAAKRDPQHPDLEVVTDLVQTKARLYPVGRLDLNSEGLVLLTNDGELTNEITHPRYGHSKTYKVLVQGQIAEHKLNLWRSGVLLADGHRTGPCSVRFLSQSRDATWLRIVMGEGHKRQIREVAETLGHRVLRLIRTHIGPLALGDLPPGHYRELARHEVEALKKGLEKERIRKSARGKKPKKDSQERNKRHGR